MAKMKDWLADFAVARSEKAEKSAKTRRMTRTASAKKPVTADAQLLVMDREALPGAVVGNTVKYNGVKWKVVDAEYKDSVGTGIALKRVAAIDEKKVTDAPTRAYTDPGDVYDYDVREVSEIPDFQEAAERTEREIARDNAHDFTTPAGRTSNPEETTNAFADIVESPVDVPAAAPAPVEEAPAPVEEAPAPVEEAPVPVEEAPAEENKFADLIDEPAEAPAEEAPVEEPAEEEKKKFVASRKQRKASIYETNPILRKIIADAQSEMKAVASKKVASKKAVASKVAEKKAPARKESVYKTNPILKKIIEK